MIAIPFLCAGTFLLLASWVLSEMTSQADALSNWESYWYGALVSMVLGALCFLIVFLSLPVPK